jgi:hypothetical protein
MGEVGEEKPVSFILRWQAGLWNIRHRGQEMFERAASSGVCRFFGLLLAYSFYLTSASFSGLE